MQTYPGAGRKVSAAAGGVMAVLALGLAARAQAQTAAPGRAGARWAEETRQAAWLARAGRWGESLRRAGEDTLAADQAGQAAPAAFGAVFRARFQLKFDQLRNERCSSADLGNPVAGCTGGFPTPSLDEQFDLRAGGVLGERIHVNVDFDSEREFSATNQIRLWYEGAEGETVRRIEVGNVSLATPASRFVTSAVPANAFGVQMLAQFGRLEFRSILAQQRGSSIRHRVFTVGERTTQPVEFELRDVDVETGRFFFAVDPRRLPGYPALDVLTLDQGPLPPTLRPIALRVYRFRAPTAPIGAAQTLDGIEAVALRSDGPQRVGPVPWELLMEGRDYYADPSGVWFALATRASAGDYLAVSYVTAAGDTVGTFPAVHGGTHTLELIHEPRRGPEAATAAHELRNAYRLGTGEILRGSVVLTVLLNRSERPPTGGTYLSLLGLAQANDPNAVDAYSRVFPRERDPSGGAPVRDLFVVFPHLTPFADSTRLVAAERSDSLYRTPSYLLTSQGPAPRFRLRIRYHAAGAGERSTLNLGAIQVREGSERLTVGDRDLERGRDYEIFYDIGQVTFTSPDALFPPGGAEVRVQFEEHQLFDVAPKNVLGLASTYHLGSHGQVSAVGLLQREQSAFTRPQLGFEPQSHAIGGISTSLAFTPNGLTRALNRLPLVATEAPSRFALNAEIAVSRPNPNQSGVAYLEEFEGGAASRAITLAEQAFQLGSRPASGRGLPATHLSLSGEFDTMDAVTLVWQNGVQIGNEVVEFAPRDIDSTIVLTGTARQIERVLWLTLKPDTVGGAPHPVTGAPRWVRPGRAAPRWRSISQPLDRSGVGLDLSTAEFLEFWMLEDENRSAAQAGVQLVLDFGTAFEDAVAPVPATFQVSGDTVFGGVRFAGAGRLDTERDTLVNVFNAAQHDRGLHGDRLDSIVNTATGETALDLPLCQSGPAVEVPVFPLGALSARCTRGNGLMDTEDLNGDNRLDVAVGTVGEDLFRYIVPVGDDRYVVRTGGTRTDRTGRRLVWRLHRIPFREDTLLIGAPDVRHVRALRMTVVAPDLGLVDQEVFVALARMRLQGAPWLKRAAAPLVGLAGGETVARGEVVAAVVGTENRDLGYTPPPGVVDQADRRGLGLQFTSQQINERSLRLLARDVRLGERAEAFTRFAAEADRNFLKYRELRVWVQGRGAGWDEGDFEFHLKVGSDEHNFYLYRTARRAGTWEPEVVVDLSRWIALRGTVEAAWLSGASPSGAAACGGDSTAFVACDGPYLVHLRDPGIAPPNLARVSEIAVAVYRAAETAVVNDIEMWVDDIRLAGVVQTAGAAATLEARLSAGDVVDLAIQLNHRDDRFRQLDEQPSYVTDRSARITAAVRLDALLPVSLGLAAPLRLEFAQVAADPFYLRQTDVPAAALGPVRRPGAGVAGYRLDLRRTRAGETAAERMLADPLSLSVSRDQGRNTTELTRAKAVTNQVRVDYDYRPGPRRVGGTGLRWNPHQVYVRSHLQRREEDRYTFRAPVERLGDSTAALASPSSLWRTQAGLDLRPAEPLVVRVDYHTLRDLRDYGDSTAAGRLLRLNDGQWLGQDVGFERERSFTTGVSLAPAVGAWLRPRAGVSTGFTLIRDPNVRDVTLTVDSAGALRLPLAVTNSRRHEAGARVEPARLASGGRAGPVGAVLRAIQPAELSVIHDRRSSFDRLPDIPGTRYQLGFGPVEEFRGQLGTLAVTAGESATWTAVGGALFPLGGRVRLTYRDVDGTTWIRRGGDQFSVRQTSREWPSFAASWATRFGGTARGPLAGLDARVQHRDLRSASRQEQLAAGTAGVLVTQQRTRLWTPSLTLSWIGGITTGGQYNRADGMQLAAGTETRTAREDWGANLGFAFSLPEWLLRMDSPLRATLAGTGSDVRVCVVRAGTTDCATIADSRRRQVDVRVDTGFSPTVVGGLSFSYILNDQRHLSSRFSQIVFTVFADVSVVAGRLP